MKLSMLPIVQRTAAALAAVEADIDAVEKDLVQVTIIGRVQDEAMTASIRCSLLAELQGRRASLLRDLDSYGVKADR